MTVTVGQVALALDADAIGDGSVVLNDATHDSRFVGNGFLFCCVSGENVDGHDYAAQATVSGASALLVDRELPIETPQIVVPNVRRAMGFAAKIVHGHPSSQLVVVGVTGTNGKSSIVQMFSDIWKEAGVESEIFGTLSGARTTPEATDLQRGFREAVDRGVKAVALEVSSHALTLHRVNGVSFDLGLFTNLGHDHLDFHNDMEDYFQAKALLFTSGLLHHAVINEDDPYGVRLIDQLESSVSYSVNDAKELTMSGPKSQFRWQDQDISLPLAGTHNVSNAVGAATGCQLLNISPAVIASALTKTRPVDGRFEIVTTDEPFWVAVDYAHTPDALQVVLLAAREASTSGRVITVYGCGGDRDSTKRPLMGKVAEDFADISILTTDNPRSEKAADIVEAVLIGCSKPESVLNIPDRREAISTAISEAKPGDVVVITGKGHELGQIIGSTTYPFSDVGVAKEVLELAE